MESFGPYFQQALEAAGLSRRAFAAKVGYKAPNVNQIVHGKRPPPLKHVDKWAKALGTVVDHAKFRQLALLAHCPMEIQTEFTRLQQLARRHEGK